MLNQVYGIISISVSRKTNHITEEQAIIESENIYCGLSVEKYLSEKLAEIGLDIHNVEIKFEQFFSEDE